MTIDSAWTTLQEARRRVVLADPKKADSYSERELLNYLITRLPREFAIIYQILDT